MDPIDFLMLPGSLDKGVLEIIADTLLSNVQRQWQQTSLNTPQNAEHSLKAYSCCSLFPLQGSASYTPVDLCCLTLGIPLKQLALTLSPKAESYNTLSYWRAEKEKYQIELDPLLIQERKSVKELLDIRSEYLKTPNNLINRWNRAYAIIDTRDKEETFYIKYDDIRKQVDLLKKAIRQCEREIAKEEKLYSELKADISL